MKRSLLFLFISLALLYIVRAFEYAGIRRNNKGEFAKLRVAFEETNNFDILILGSSRAECQYYPPIIDSTFGFSTFNNGMTGATLPLIQISLEAYLVHSKTPKFVILNLDLHNFSDVVDTIYNFPRYFAYLDNEKLYEGLKERDRRFLYFKYLPFYSMPFYSSRYFNYSLRGWTRQEGEFDADYVNGFAPTIKDEKIGDLDTLSLPFSNHLPPKIIFESLHEIQKICKSNGCKLILVLPPIFYRQEEKVLNYPTLISEFHQFADKNLIPFIDLGHDSIRFDKNFYSDPVHLNKQGALHFTRHLSLELTQYIKP